MAFLSKETTESILKRSSGKCECADTEHGHAERCGNDLDHDTHFMYDPDMPLHLRAVCYSCYRKKKASAKKQR